MLTYFFFNLHISLHRKYTSSKNIYLFARDLKQVENHAFGEFYCPGSQRVQINFIFPDSVRILCLSCNAKNPKSTLKLSDKAETVVVLIVFDDVLCEVRAYNWYRFITSRNMNKAPTKLY